MMLRLVAILVLAAGIAPGAEPRLDRAARIVPAGQLLQELGQLTGGAWFQDLDELVAGAGDTRTLIALRGAAPAAIRQAVAHSLGCWWVVDADHGTRLTRAPALPAGRLSPRVLSSSLDDRHDALVLRLMAPYLGGHAGLTHDREDAAWLATLDPDGHAHLVEVLTLLERPVLQAPDLVPDARQPAPDTPLRRPPAGSAWVDLAQDLADLTGTSVAVRLPLPPPRFAQAPRTFGEIPGSLAGVQAAWIQGVLCIGAQQPADAAHPAIRRRLASLPIAPLLTADRRLTAPAIAERLRQRTGAARWLTPGYALEAIDGLDALLVAADAPMIHAVLAELERWDDAGVAATDPPAATSAAPSTTSGTDR